MKTIGVKELKKHLSEVLREVEENGQVISVSNRGRIVARLVPARSGKNGNHNPRDTVAAITALAEEISADLPATVSVDEIINDIRR